MERSIEPATRLNSPRGKPNTDRSAVARVYLVGFMGAGKSTVGRLLADRLAWRFYDIDRVIEEEQKQSVAALFASQGEPAFRALEHEMIRRLQAEERAVIALGGGAIETAAIRGVLHGHPGNRVIFLRAPLPLLIARCLTEDGGASRPVLKNQELLQARYDLRLTYFENAHLTVETQALTPEDVAARIVNQLAALTDAHHSPIVADR